MTANGRRAVSVLSGFLGSGKTTLLRGYLRRHPGDDIVVIINEWGAVGLDHDLIRTVKEQSILLQGGCVCCARREDLVRALRELLDLEQGGDMPAMRQVVIETSGLADPVPVLFTLATDPVLKHHFAAASVVVTLDAVNAGNQIERQPEVRKQLVAADRVVITKPDLASGERVAELRAWMRQLNPTARILVSCLGEASDALDLPDEAEHARALATLEPPLAPHPEVQSATLGFSGPLDWPAFSVWLGMLLEAHGPNMLRIKGLLDIGDAGPVVLNTAQHTVHPPEHLSAWPQGSREPYLVFITRGIDPARIARSLEAFQRAGGRGGLRVTRIDQACGGRA
ncbi:MAG: GTP-binding protein [Pseudomonadota bacterium]|nr:GTP-binding protein [Pseudomonadota bacterium]